jgi:NUDIX domain
MTKQDIVLRVAAKAVIVNDDNQVLLVREARSYGDGTQLGKYGIPGGRLDVGEKYEIKGVKHQIIAVFTVCKATSSKVILSEEHDDYVWAGSSDLEKIVLMDPDDKVLARFFDSKLS